MKKSNYNIPETRKEKIELLKRISSGELSIGDLSPDTMSVEMSLNPTPEERIEFEANLEKQNDWKGDPAITFLTFTMDAIPVPTDFQPLIQDNIPASPTEAKEAPTVQPQPQKPPQRRGDPQDWRELPWNKPQEPSWVW